MKFNGSLLKKDINLYMRTFGEAYIKDAVKQIENEAKNCVMYFYSTYCRQAGKDSRADWTKASEKPGDC